MKPLLIAALMLSFLGTAHAGANSPANRCKRYANANAFEQTAAQICGTKNQNAFATVLEDQSCADQLGSEKALKEQQAVYQADVEKQLQTLGKTEFCKKYAK